MQDRWYQEESVDALFDFYSEPRRFDENGIPEDKNALVCLPTGTGKSVVQAKFLKRALHMFASTRAMSLTHVKTLIGQNAKKLQEIWPLSPLGVYSAGLKSRDAVQPIIFGGIQSAVKKYPLFGFRDFLFVDEAHLVGDDGSYLKMIHELKYGHTEWEKPVTRQEYERAVANPYCNPFLKTIGMSATPYRQGMGLLTNGPIFTDIVYDLCNIDGFNRLIAEGFLSPVVPKRTNTLLDVSGVGMSKGDFNQTQLQGAVDKYETTLEALKEVVAYGNNPQDYRHSWMVFASGIEHAEHIAEILNNYFGIPTVCLHSKQGEGINEENLKLWKSGQARCAVSMNKLTTGVDHPPVDLIAMLRPTMSTGLWVQMLGRGTRPYDFRFPGDVDPAAFPYIKINCLVLDFAGNTRRLGPINDPIIPRRKGEGPPGDAPVRICEVCNTYNHASARVCIVCGTEFPVNDKLNKTAGTDELLRSDLPQIEMVDVQRMIIVPHKTLKGDNAIKVAYYCGLRTFFEYKSVETPANFYKHKSREWFRQVYDYSRPVWQVTSVDTDEDGKPDDVPNTNAGILALMGNMRAPARLKVWMNANPKPDILGYEF